MEKRSICHRGRLLAVALAAPLALSACEAVVATGAATTGGVVVTQERSFEDAVDDAAIETRISYELYTNEVNKDLFVEVDVESVEGRVLLTGSVRSPEDRIEAVRLAWQAKEVKEVINEIQVTDAGGLTNYSRDVWITTRLRGKILLDKTIRGVNYNVDTVNGIVYLIGIAQDDAELSRVTQIARTISHVKKVVSHVRVLPPS